MSDLENDPTNLQGGLQDQGFHPNSTAAHEAKIHGPLGAGDPRDKELGDEGDGDEETGEVGFHHQQRSYMNTQSQQYLSSSTNVDPTIIMERLNEFSTTFQNLESRFRLLEDRESKRDQQQPNPFESNRFGPQSSNTIQSLLPNTTSPTPNISNNYNFGDYNSLFSSSNGYNSGNQQQSSSSYNPGNQRQQSRSYSSGNQQQQFQQSYLESISRLNPVQSLNMNIKSVTKQTLSTAQASYSPWLSYMESILQSVYLTCVMYMLPHEAPKTETEWTDMDDLEGTNEVRKTVKEALNKNEIPVINKKDSFKALNAVFLGTVDFNISAFHMIFTLLKNSLDPSMKYLATDRPFSPLNFRMIFFGARKHFEISTEKAKALKLKDFLTRTDYPVTESIEAFSIKLLKKSQHINDLYGQVILHPAIVKEILIDAITSKTAGKFETTLEILRDRQAKYEDIVQSLNDKYLELKSNTSVSLEQVFSAQATDSSNSTDLIQVNSHAGTSFLDCVYAVNSFKGNKKSLPCFQFRNTGKCAFGDKCKYSHDPKIVNRKANEFRREQINAAIMDQLNHLTETVLLAHKQKNKWKRNVGRAKAKLRNFKDKRKSSNRTNKTNDTTYIQDVANVAEEIDDSPQLEGSIDDDGIHSDDSFLSSESDE